MIVLNMFSILEKRKWNFGEVSLLINDFKNINTENIIYIAKNIKRLNIVTNHIEKYKKVEEYLYNEFGIILNVSNNKKTSLAKAEIIVNIDFPKENLNKYRIYDKAIIFNISDIINVESKRFNGTNINYYKIAMPKEYMLDEFENEIMYESIIYQYNDLKKVRKRIKKDKIKIKKLIGKNGPIIENEILL